MKCVLYGCLVLILCEKCLSQVGPYKVVFNQLAVCDDPIGDIDFPTRVSHKSRTVLSYSCDPCVVKKPLDDSTSLTLNFAKFGNGGWKANFFTLHYKKLCKDAWPIMGKSAEGLLNKNSQNKTYSCPIKAGNYEIKNYEINIERYEKIFPVLPHGKFRLDIDFRKNSVRVGCLRIFVDVTPKNKGRG